MRHYAIFCESRNSPPPPPATCIGIQRGGSLVGSCPMSTALTAGHLVWLRAAKTNGSGGNTSRQRHPSVFGFEVETAKWGKPVGTLSLAGLSKLERCIFIGFW